MCARSLQSSRTVSPQTQNYYFHEQLLLNNRDSYKYVLKLAEELEIEGLSHNTISVYMNFSKVVDDVSSENRNKLCFLYKCPKSWRNIKKYLKKTEGSRSRPVVGNCPLWTALNEVDL